ncbi:MAG: L-histidine N(alpha)-methyltransferase [Alphaproteobacteria bacterium]
MSGALGWKRYEHDCPSYYILRCEREMIGQVANDLHELDLVPQGVPFIDLGPGTIEAVEEKSLPVVLALNSHTYVPVDVSLKFCSEAGGVIKQHLRDVVVSSSVENFFSDEVDPALDTAGIGFLGGITIANIEAPLSKEKPTQELINGLKNLARITGGGWLLLTTDANQSEAENKAMYSENGLFEINTFYRMAHELPFKGLNPDGFVYDPYWIPESSQLGHTALATEDMLVEVSSSCFTGIIPVRKGQRYHLKNSFKYTDEFFIRCAKAAGYSVIEKWSHHEKPLRFFLLKAPALELAARNDSQFPRQALLEKRLIA